MPPRDKDTQPDVEVHLSAGTVTTLQTYSEVVRGIGEDFMRHVKRIRLFVHPIAGEGLLGKGDEVRETIEQTLAEF